MRYRLIIVGSLFSCFFIGWGQSQVIPQSKQKVSDTRAKLERERLLIIERIEEADNLLQKNSSNQKTTLINLKTLEGKINNRERLISTIQNELILAEKELGANKNKTTILTKDLKSIQEKYYNLLNNAYKQHLSFNKWAFILNSASINESFSRWRYIKQYEAYCRRAYGDITTTNVALISSEKELKKAILERKALLSQESSQFELLLGELAQKDKFLLDLKSQESNLKESIEEQKQDRERLNTSIESTIIAALKGLVDDEPDPSIWSNNSVAHFASSKGILDWPIKSGEISGAYGRQKHPTVEGVIISNNGVDIVTKGEQNVTCVFSGTVVGVNEIPGFGKTIIVHHDGYYTVYSKLESSHVHKDDVISKGQQIGVVSQNKDGDRELHFEIWNGKKTMNPSKWLD